MVAKVIVSSWLSLMTLSGAAQSRAGGPGADASTPPIKMGLWEATTTSSSLTFKSRSCITPQSYREALAKLPPGCTLTNQTRTAGSMSGDVSCTMPSGSTTGHFEAQFPDPGTVHSTIDLNMTLQGRTMQRTIKTESHWVSASCGDLAPGQTKEVE